MGTVVRLTTGSMGSEVTISPRLSQGHTRIKSRHVKGEGMWSCFSGPVSSKITTSGVSSSLPKGLRLFQGVESPCLWMTETDFTLVIEN